MRRGRSSIWTARPLNEIYLPRMIGWPGIVFQAETATELDALLPDILDKAFKGEL